MNSLGNPFGQYPIIDAAAHINYSIGPYDFFTHPGPFIFRAPEMHYQNNYL